MRSTHERWDGNGYPDRLAGEEIPLGSRIIAACTAFTAMTSERPYRRRMTDAEALAELRRCAGTQFDPRVAQAIEIVVREAALATAA
jgi:HD-GYP domain-containing protein (c-di-GMP phosphodiesterase class II)